MFEIGLQRLWNYNIRETNWVVTVKKDIQITNMQLSLSEIKQMSKSSFKRIVHTKVRQAVFDELIVMKNTHSKLNNISYKEFIMQPYLKSSVINTSQAKQLFRYRGRMSNTRKNFRSKYKDDNILCPLEGCNEVEDDKHLLACSITENLIDNVQVNFEDLYSGSVQKQKIIINLLMSAKKIRDSLLDKINPTADDWYSIQFGLQRDPTSTIFIYMSSYRYSLLFRSVSFC